MAAPRFAFSFHLGAPLAVMVLLGLLCGAAVLLRPDPPPAHLTVWTFADQHYKTFESILDIYRRRTGHSVNLSLIQYRALRIRLSSAFLTNQGDDLPDLVEVEIGAIGQFLRPPLRDVGFLDLTDRLKSSGWYDRLIQSRFAPWSKEGRIFGVPHDVHPVTITYRDDLFRQAGIDLASATTWPRFHHLCIQFKDYWRRQGVPHRHAIELPAATSDYLVVMLLQRGINPIDDFGRIHLDDPRAAHTVAFYAQLVAGAGNIASESTGGVGPFTRDLQEGNICAYITPDWRIPFIRRYAVNREDPARDLTGRMRMMPLPLFDPDDAPTSTWGGTMMGIPRSCKDPDRAWTLLEFLYFSPEGLQALRLHADILPPITSYWDQPYYHQPDPFFGGQKINEMFTHLARQIPRRYVTPATGIANANLTYVLNLAVDHVNRHGAEALEENCRRWLKTAAADLQRRMDHWRFAEAE